MSDGMAHADAAKKDPLRKVLRFNAFTFPPFYRDTMTARATSASRNAVQSVRTATCVPPYVKIDCIYVLTQV